MSNEVNETMAFPRAASPLPFSDQYQAQDGMTLLDYFAAHAPVDVPPWFEETVPPMPRFSERKNPFYEAIGIAYTGDGQNDWSEEVRPVRNEKSTYFVPKEEEVRLARIYWEKKEVERGAFNQWQKDKAIARQVQWPYEWARLQIKERSRISG